MVSYGLKVTVKLLKNINYEFTYEKIANFIFKSFLQNDELTKMHEENKYKMYTFCSLYPFEKDGIYKKEKVYYFDIKTLDLDFALKVKQYISMTKNEEFQVVMTNIITNKYHKIEKLITLTPAILTTKKGDYKIDGDLELVKTRVIAGAEKKYKQLYDEELKVDFIKDIRQTNIKPIKLPYKNIYFLGNKFEVDIKEDEDSQKLAFIILATGMLEKNAEGFGFCKAR